jgi:hypothetical protein
MRIFLTNGYKSTAFAGIVLVGFCLSHLASVVAAPTSDSFFDSAKGFKPAQTDLTEIFLQIAKSLEFYGSPVPYLRHMKQEHARIEADYKQRTGKVPTSHCPPYMDDDYINQVSETWDKLSPKVGLIPMTKHIGDLMTDAIQGTRGTGTILVEIFNTHQAHVFDAMAGRRESAGFDELQSQLIERLELDKAEVNEAQYELPQRDAVGFSLGIQGTVIKLYKKLDSALSPEDATKIKTALTSIILDVGKMAQSELEAGITEWSVSNQNPPAK